MRYKFFRLHAVSTIVHKKHATRLPSTSTDTVYDPGARREYPQMMGLETVGLCTTVPDLWARRRDATRMMMDDDDDG